MGMGRLIVSYTEDFFCCCFFVQFFSVGDGRDVEWWWNRMEAIGGRGEGSGRIGSLRLSKMLRS